MGEEEKRLAQSIANKVGQQPQNRGGEDNYKDRVLSFDSVLNAVHSLEGLDIVTKWHEREDGGLIGVDYVRKDGVWIPMAELDESEMDELRKNGLMNNEGVSKTKSIISLIANPVVGASKFRSKEAGKLKYYLSVSLTDALEGKMNAYGIQDYDDLSLILNGLDSLAAGIIDRSRGGTLLEHLGEKTDHRIVETKSGDEDSKMPNLF